MIKKNGFAPVIIVLIVVILAVVGYFSYKNYSRFSQLPTSTTTSNPTPTSCPTPNDKERNYKPPLSVRPDVIYPGAQFVERTIIPPCDACRQSVAECYGSSGLSGGVDFSYKVQAPFKDVITWYKDKWHMVGGGGTMNDNNGESGDVFGTQISESGNLDTTLYYMSIAGDKLNTTIDFQSNSLTSN